MEKGEFTKRQKAKESVPLLAAMGAIDQTEEAIFEDVPDFHRKIKAEFLVIAPTQLVRETTIAPDAFLNKAGYPLRKTQDAATVAWNLATGLYYKTQPKPPWRLAAVRPGVSYIGMVYKSLPNDPDGHACCAAQMFLEGDGVVFRGAEWTVEDRRISSFISRRLRRKNLLTLVLKTYSETHGGLPKELFIHRTDLFQRRGVERLCRGGPRRRLTSIGVRIRSTGGETKLFRDGDYPVLRGTALLLDDQDRPIFGPRAMCRNSTPISGRRRPIRSTSP